MMHMCPARYLPFGPRQPDESSQGRPVLAPLGSRPDPSDSTVVASRGGVAEGCRAACRSLVRVLGRLRRGEEPPLRACRRRCATSCVCRLPPPFAHRERSGAARGRVASLAQRELERLATARGNVRVVIVRGEHQAEGVENVLTRLLGCSPLADGAWNLDHARDDPPVFVGLVVGDRQP
jgi:hypothetical protein